MLQASVQRFRAEREDILRSKDSTYGAGVHLQATHRVILTLNGKAQGPLPSHANIGNHRQSASIHLRAEHIHRLKLQLSKAAAKLKTTYAERRSFFEIVLSWYRLVRAPPQRPSTAHEQRQSTSEALSVLRKFAPDLCDYYSGRHAGKDYTTVPGAFVHSLLSDIRFGAGTHPYPPLLHHLALATAAKSASAYTQMQLSLGGLPALRTVVGYRNGSAYHDGFPAEALAELWKRMQALGGALSPATCAVTVEYDQMKTSSVRL